MTIFDEFLTNIRSHDEPDSSLSACLKSYGGLRKEIGIKPTILPRKKVLRMAIGSMHIYIEWKVI
jgi:hypothetical protein